MSWKKWIIGIFLLIGTLTSACSLYNSIGKTESEAKRLMIEDVVLSLKEPYYIEGDHVFILAEGLKNILPKESYAIEDNRLWLRAGDYMVQYEDDFLTKQIQNMSPPVNFPLKQLNSGWYIELERFSDWANIKWHLNKNKTLLILDSANEQIYGIAKSGVKVYAEPKQKGKRLITLTEGEKVRVFGDVGNEYKVRTEEGLIGYVEARRINIYSISDEQEKPFTLERKKLSQYTPISIAFEFVSTYSSNPNLESQTRIDGLDVLCPTWFTLDEKGRVVNDASIRYVRQAHDQQYRVWGLFKNGFEPERTHLMLSDENLVNQTVASIAFYSSYYELDGINIDFENVYKDDRSLLNDFLKKLDAVLTRQGVTLSVDAAVPWGSDQWSLFLDRVTVSQIADYIILMAYDEHYASSKISGSVSSLPWAEKAVTKTLEMIPPEKLILGVPLYTRIWRETNDGNGGLKVTSKAIGMKDQEPYLRGKSPTYSFDDKAGQMVASFKEGEDTLKIWMEDETSMKSRLKMAHTFHLAGAASWRRGFESPEFWKWNREILKGK